MNEQTTRIIAFLESAGASEIRLRESKRHDRIVFVWKGCERFYVVPRSPSDTWCGALNAISNLKHQFGLIKRIKRVGERRKPQKRPNVNRQSVIFETVSGISPRLSLAEQLEAWKCNAPGFEAGGEDS